MIERRHLLFILFVSLWAMTIPSAVLGQGLGSAGTVKGTVKDPSGAVIPGATVTIHNPVTGFERTASTDARVASPSPTYPLIPITSPLPIQASLRTCKTSTSTPRCPSI